MKETDREEGAVQLFLGVGVDANLAETIRQTALAVRDQIAADEVLSRAVVSWMAPARYHLTLKYLGWSRPETVQAIRDRVKEVGQKHGELRVPLGGLDAFGSLGAAHVLFQALESSDGLIALVGDLDSCLAEIGFPLETRAFRPHITIARFKEVADLNTAGVGSEHSSSTRERSLLVRSIDLFEIPAVSDAYEYPSLANWKLSNRKRHRSDLERQNT